MENIEFHKNLPRDVFLYLLSVITLAVSAISFGTIVFQLINVKFPDVLTPQPLQSLYSGIRWAIAALIVVFPAYLWTMKFLNKDLEVNPQKKELKIRKWLLYFALFVAAIVIIVDSITLIFNFLQGELTLRFFLKVLTVFVIAGGIFLYYFKIIKAEKSWIISIVPKVAVVLVVGFVIFGLITAGLPKSQRLFRLDERRMEDLSSLENQIIEYSRRTNKLPETLDNLNELNFSLPKDPVAEASYEYHVVGDLKFELCAAFQTSGEEATQLLIEQAYPKPINLFYEKLQKHKAGRDCFERQVSQAEIKTIEADKRGIM